jgi:glucose/arabinose dehydrogenase
MATRSSQAVIDSGRGSTHLRSAFLAFAVALGLVACSGPQGTPQTSTVPAATGSDGIEPSGSGSTPPTEPASDEPGSAFDPSAVHLQLQKVVGGLDQPVGVTSAGDGTGRLFVIEQTGRIRIVENGKLLAQPFLDLHDKVSCCGERGLLGLAFEPGFGADATHFFVDYTDPKGNTAVASVAVDPSNPDVADASSLAVILHVEQPFANHNGGGLAFGPDGDLYVALGDGGSGGDPQGNGQKTTTLLGKLLRLDVTSGSPDAPPAYTIPEDNPFPVGGADRAEIWAFGLRNPWRFSFDRQSGDLWIGDVGQGEWEEIDVGRASEGRGRGANYGWNVMEGRHCFASDPCKQTDFVPPITEYDHSTGDCAVIGGYVYHGEAYPVLAGGYLFGDECSGRIRAIGADGPAEQDPTILLDTNFTLSSFGEDDDGELYVTDLAGGSVYRVTASGG